MRVVENLTAWGHPIVKATHITTFEITKDSHLTERGDCIIAIAASKGARDLSNEFRKHCRSKKALIRCKISVGDTEIVIRGRGDPRLTLTHATDLVGRKSQYVCPRTLMVRANRSSAEIPRKIIRKLRDSREQVHIALEVET